MDIKFIKDITEKDRDGFRLLYKVDEHELEVRISRTLLGMFNINAYTVEELFERFRLEAMIDSIDTFFSKENNYINKIDLDSDGLKIKGRVYYSTDKLKDFVAIKK
jgi:hypothetical protein